MGKQPDVFIVHLTFGTSISLCLDAWLRQVPLDIDALADQMSQMILFGLAGRP